MYHDRYMIDRWMRQERLKRPGKDRLSGKASVLFRKPFPRSGSTSGGDNEGDDWHAGRLSVVWLLLSNLDPEGKSARRNVNHT
jgi:hypothetical protein